MTFVDYIRKKLNLTNAPSSSGSRNPKQTTLKRLGLAFTKSSGSAARTDFQEPDFDLSEITNAYNTDSYVRQAIDKYVDLMFKAGWDITGKNQQAVDYVKIRLAVMAEATQTPTKQFWLDIAEDLVKYGNAFIIRARASGTYSLPAGVTATPYNNTKIVAGYFVLPATTIEIARDENGTVLNYQQDVTGKTKIQFKPEDIIHIYWKKERGQAFGVPFLLPVIDDVKMLRQVEEDVIRLIYRHLFPLHVYTVGLPEPGFQATDEEIESVREEIRNMPLDGGLVIPERHKIDIVGTQGEALDAKNYLEYFRKRVFTGLGVSETIMGIGDTANRGTAESMTTEMHDRIKAFQRVMAEGVAYHIITEILHEGGFDPLVNPDDAVEFQFKEIDLEMRTKIEQSVNQLWVANMITFEEARQMLGRDPAVDENRLYFKMIGTTEINDQATADVQVAQAKAAATPTTTTKPASTTTKPASTTKPSTTTKKTAASFSESVNESLQVEQFESQLQYHWELTRSDIVEMIKQYYLRGEREFTSYDSKEIDGIIHLTRESMIRVAEKYIRPAFLRGVDAARHQAGRYQVPNLNYEAVTKELIAYQRVVISRLLDEDLDHQITVAMRSSKAENAIAKIMGSFQALSFRLSFVANSELYRAYNYGFARCAYALGYEEVEIIGDGGCETCILANGTRVSTKNITVTSPSIPPLHPNCTCALRIPSKEV